jgi:hypothetical protein
VTEIVKVDYGPLRWHLLIGGRMVRRFATRLDAELWNECRTGNYERAPVLFQRELKRAGSRMTRRDAARFARMTAMEVGATLKQVGIDTTWDQWFEAYVSGTETKASLWAPVDHAPTRDPLEGVTLVRDPSKDPALHDALQKLKADWVDPDDLGTE